MGYGLYIVVVCRRYTWFFLVFIFIYVRFFRYISLFFLAEWGLVSFGGGRGCVLWLG